MAVYYNELDKNAASWLRNLIKSGHIPDGDVDNRSIVEVDPQEIAGYTQCHFFAGIGGWAYAARLAGYPDDKPLWTGSCPCQPFSVAGKGEGVNDVRHLWPHFFRLIRAARPAVVMGEQVARAAGYGWFDGVSADLAGEGYASRCVDIPSLAVDAPHIRSRLYWLAVGDASSTGLSAPELASFVGSGRRHQGRAATEPNGASGPGFMADAELLRRVQGAGERATGCAARGHVSASRHGGDGQNGSFWSDHEWIVCHDGKARRTKPGISMLVAGVPARISKWRGIGNAINTVLAAEVIAAYLDTEQEEIK